MTTLRKILVSVIATLCLASVSAKHTTVVVSLDGFRWDYTQWYRTPFLDFMAERGVESALIPSFPSKTFPNHYTIATGLYLTITASWPTSFTTRERATALR